MILEIGKSQYYFLIMLKIIILKILNLCVGLCLKHTKTQPKVV